MQRVQFKTVGSQGEVQVEIEDIRDMFKKKVSKVSQQFEIISYRDLFKRERETAVAIEIVRCIVILQTNQHE